jgi:SnoaL-like protein
VTIIEDNAFEWDELRIGRLHAAYVDAVNRKAWGEFEELFTPTAELTVEVSESDPVGAMGPEAIGALIDEFLKPLDFLFQTVMNARIAPGGDPDTARARLYIHEFRQVTATGALRNSVGVYEDHYRRLDGRWLFDRRSYTRLVLAESGGTTGSTVSIHEATGFMELPAPGRRGGVG